MAGVTPGAAVGVRDLCGFILRHGDLRRYRPGGGDLAEMGAIIEECAGVIKAADSISWESMYEIIRYVGPEHCIISSDCGNVNKPYPDVAMENMAERLCQNGFTQEEVRRMAVINTAMLVEE